MNFINDVKTLTENIKHWYLLDAQNGKNWYKEALMFCKDNKPERFNLFQVVGVIASLSANTAWKQNKVLLCKYMAGNYVGHIGKDKAMRIIAMDDPTIEDVADVVGGPKTKAFYYNILGRNDQITLDRHAINLALSKVRHASKIHYTPKRRRMLKEAYQNVANEFGVHLPEIQAVTWSNYITT